MGSKQNNWPEESKDLEDYQLMNDSSFPKDINVSPGSPMSLPTWTPYFPLYFPSPCQNFFFFSRQKRTGPQILATGPHGLVVRTWCSHRPSFREQRSCFKLLFIASYYSAVCLESTSLSNSLLLLPAFLRGKNKQVCSIFSTVSVNDITCLVLTKELKGWRENSRFGARLAASTNCL